MRIKVSGKSKTENVKVRIADPWAKDTKKILKELKNGR